MDQAAILPPRFTVAAYVITWAIQLGDLVWLGVKWPFKSGDRRDRKAIPE